MRFGDRLRELRATRDLTQQELADALGLSGAYISALESGRKPAPPRIVVEQLAAALGVDAEDLWSTARAEREDRLRARIEGVPTSLHVEERTDVPTAAPSAAHVAAAAERHPEIGRFVLALDAALADPAARRGVLTALEGLLRGLVGNPPRGDGESRS